MPDLVRLLLLMLASAVLLADVGFIIWATKLNFLIVVPALLSACYLFYIAAHFTIIKLDEKDKSDSLGIGAQETRPRVHAFGEESSASRTRSVTPTGGDVPYPRPELG